MKKEKDNMLMSGSMLGSSVAYVFKKAVSPRLAAVSPSNVLPVGITWENAINSVSGILGLVASTKNNLSPGLRVAACVAGSNLIIDEAATMLDLNKYISPVVTPPVLRYQPRARPVRGMIRPVVSSTVHNPVSESSTRDSVMDPRARWVEGIIQVD